jgi:prevent-host-death family protein
MEHVVSATETRIRFGELMRRAVEGRKPIFVEHGGKLHVVVLSEEQYELLLLRQRHGDWREMVRRARAQSRADLGGRRLPPPEQVLAQMREERDEQLLDMR